MKVAYLDVGGPAQRDAAAVGHNIARENGSEVTWLGVAAWTDHSSISRRFLRSAAASAVLSRRTSGTGAYDMIVVPAGVTVNGPTGHLASEASAILANSRGASVLRVRRRPLAITRILMLLDSTPACRALARRFVQLGIWRDAWLAVLPMDRPSVGLFLQSQVEMLRSYGRAVTVLPALDLNFEKPELESILHPFHAAVMAHLSHRVGLYFGAVRNDPFAIVAERVPLVLLP